MKTEEEIRKQIKELELDIKHPSIERWSEIKAKYYGMKEALEWVLEEDKN